MLLDTDVLPLLPVPPDLILNFAEIVSNVDWTLPEFNRNGDKLPSRTVIIPYGCRPEPFQQDTEVVLRIRKGVEPISAWLQDQYPEYVLFKGEINYISPNSTIPFHVDPCWFHAHARRIHIPITTQPGSVWLQHGQATHMPVGMCYEVNNVELHSFSQQSDQGRVHVIVDIIKKDVYQQAIKDGIDVNSVITDSQACSAEKMLSTQYKFLFDK